MAGVGQTREKDTAEARGEPGVGRRAAEDTAVGIAGWQRPGVSPAPWEGRCSRGPAPSRPGLRCPSSLQSPAQSPPG